MKIDGPINFAPRALLIGAILQSNPLNANHYEDIHDSVQRGASSTLDPGRHLASLDVAGLLPLHLSWITSDAASYGTVSDHILETGECDVLKVQAT